MATVPPGPSNALPTSPVEVAPFSGAGRAEPAVEAGEATYRVEVSVSAGTGKKSQPANEVKGSAKKKHKNMLARASPAALHLKMQAGEQQQLNGLVSPSEDPDEHQHAGGRADNLKPSEDNCDSEAAAAMNSTEHCQHEGHNPFSKNGNHSPVTNSSVNGMPAFTRTEAVYDGEDRRDHAQPTREAGVSDGPGGEESPVEPPAEELARLDLSGSPGRAEGDSHSIRYVRYESELQMPWIMRLITKDLSEPYSIYTYRYFIHNWPQLCFLECVGAIVCKLDMHKKMFRRGYIAMLAVDSKHRRKSIGTNLVKKAIYAMVEGDCDEVVLETEITNKSALKLYENLGFVRDKRLFRYYLNGVDALRLKLWLR
ncbi:N-alpha-acetyltransferase 30 isoform X2 [Poeciliopsis prolifica]|uniref:N-alpha-acetyltransferase 30 isoform X2 n=1 Tax=Poeciliopsis prolifica TaxID=188132 RepID=UPI002412F5BC|nr:N-alpha-acetyltransferase 30 isoform X2 [Poeciliopsis prolifica]